MSAQLTTRFEHDLNRFQRRVQRQRKTFHTQSSRHTFSQLAVQFPPNMVHMRVRKIPKRIWLHALLASLIPVSVWLSTYDLTQFTDSTRDRESSAWLAALTEQVVPLGPVQEAYTGEIPVPQSAFAEIVALPEVQAAVAAQQLLGPLTLPGTVRIDQATLRNGPGAEYDKIGEVAAGTSVLLQAKAGDWFAARLATGEEIWIAAEDVQDAPVAQGILDDATSIPPPPPPKIATIRTEGLNLRDGPGTEYAALTKLPDGTTIDLLARHNDWLEVQMPDNQVGWVSSEYLETEPGVIERVDIVETIPDPHPPLIATVNSRINLRSGPGTDYPQQGVADVGTQFDLLGRSDIWLRVRTSQGAEAWVSNEILGVDAYLLRRVPIEQNIPARPQPVAPAAPAVPAAPAPAPMGASARFSDQKPIDVAPAAASGGVVSFAMQFTGTPYVWGGAGPGGFDCSGFTQYVYAQFGLSLPHNAAAQFNSRYGAVINDIESLAPGDLVFFVNTYKSGISHVGIYAGGGQVVQALAPGVGLSSVSIYTSYWHSRYYAGIRPYL